LVSCRILTILDKSPPIQLTNQIGGDLSKMVQLTSQIGDLSKMVSILQLTSQIGGDLSKMVQRQL
jgi:hypothetical protein